MSNKKVIDCINSEVARARDSYSVSRNTLASLTKEVEELNIIIDEEDLYSIFEKAIRISAIAIRIVEEGDERTTYEFKEEYCRKFTQKLLERYNSRR